MLLHQRDQRPATDVFPSLAETTKVLLDAGADIEAKNSHEDTALQCAVAGGHLNTVRQLIERHAVLENKDDLSDSTPLHLASAKGHDAIVRLLLESGATINRRDESGKTALDLAIENGHREVARVLVESDDWMDIMSPSDTLPVGRHNLSRVTPLRKLIEKFPDIAEIVFSKCIMDHGDSPDDFYFLREYNFSLIDDTYMMPSKDGAELLSTVSPYKEDGSLKQNAKAYSDDYDVVYKNHPLRIMAQSETLLSHPLVQALLKYKWNSLGRYVYYFALGVYLLFLVTFTMYVTHTPPPFNIYDETSNEMRDFTDVFNSENECPQIMVTRPSWLAACRRVVIGLAIAQLIKELFQLITRRHKYISFDNAIECFIYTSAIISVMDLSPCSETTGIRLNWQWLLAAACAFSSWMNLLLLIRKLPRFGIYVVMFFDVLRTFSRFFIVFALFVIAFSISFFVIMQNRPEFSSIPSAVLKTTVMMIGEFEFTAIFHGDADVHPERLFGHAIAYPLFLFFCVIMTILLMNLLIGLAVDDIKSVLEEAKLKRLSMQADLVLQVEASMPYIRKLTCRSFVRIYPNQSTFLKRLRNRFGFDSSSVAMMEEEWSSKEEELLHEFREVIKGQHHQIRTLQKNVDVMYSEQVKTAAMLRALMEHLQVNFQETVKD
ncbi:transient receptor potential cation channel subfamily A member 1 [Trichostrongylus colubriformis]|uniref:Transient receptor potential cation channel subfamily A member 1 n=1 Tax=Trichostrongylus colubriformis TaxID=6319 RepID=A0AAN8IZH3_TRICO